MSELDQAYRALAHEADTVRMAAPQALRTRGDRRARVRVAAVAVAAAVAVGTALAGTQWVFRADGTSPAPIPPAATPSATPPPPTASPAATTSPTPSRSTSTAPSTPPPTAAPKSIPNSAFLQKVDANGPEQVADTPSEDVLPSLCGASFATDRDIDLERSRRITYWNPPYREGFVPDGTFRQTIRVYEAGGATRFLAEVRAAVADCPTEDDRRYRMLSAPKRGDESLMFELRYPFVPPDGEPNGNYDVRMVSVVRIGDAVTILYETGWEAGWSVEQDVMNTFTSKAFNRLRSWLD
ncbi:hypothetical protein [Phytohabitans houttuyneae]|uniref:PknH-like extracellular domain-containing protein n=1 Tax=Phytohabitans houttuyneae TaxID=1076126 RepID=A0A6V8KQP9_9ACTN|nr:hypothetical protein [Phytohabitans houttuyneae]GFJ84107.1 hypothetical protein Phou_082870 [Phytohabitans houttuyneae]